MRARVIYMPLRRQADFSRVHARGQRKGNALIQVRVLRRPANVIVTASIRLGIVVSKKFGSAVERNRFKRVVRAAIQALGAELTPGWDIIVLPREAHGVTMNEMERALRQLFGALDILTDEGTGTEGEAAV
ncbi:MAG: ribonuclease P protein component [Armatimonadota bacterium]